MSDKLMTVGELIDELANYPRDLPVKLRLVDAVDDELVVDPTMLKRNGLSVVTKSASGTEYGDLHQVVRIDVTWSDDA